MSRAPSAKDSSLFYLTTGTLYNYRILTLHGGGHAIEDYLRSAACEVVDL